MAKEKSPSAPKWRKTVNMLVLRCLFGARTNNEDM
jgi:hypothetical protein